MTGPAPMTPAPMTRAGVTRAFVYLQLTSTFNSLKQRLLRLRQPKYLVGAIAGGAYMYFFFFRRVLQAGASGRHAPVFAPDMVPQFAPIAALGLFVVVVAAWLVPSNRAALRFSEAEAAFLFPAPIARRTLIHFSLLRSQIAIFFSAFLLALLFRRGSSFGGGPLQHAAGLWLVMSTLNLHFLGASFVRERLLDLGIRPLLRRVLVGGLVLVVIAGCWWWLRTHVSLPGRFDLADTGAMRNYVTSVLGAPPVSWVLAPFVALIAPLFATDTAGLLRALVPAVLLLVVHYVWVVRSNVSFEEASIDLARRRAERITAMREGKQRLRDAPTKPRSAPFRLAPKGHVPIAFLWKGLVAMGPFWRLRTWLIACAIVIVGGYWLAADPDRQAMLIVPLICAGMLGSWLFLLGPMIMQRGLRRTLDHLDILKASPLRGWQIALGEVLTPMVVMTFVEWLLLLVLVVSMLGLGHSRPQITVANVTMAATGIALIVPPLFGLMLCVPFAALLYFPAWSGGSGTGGRGFEVMGQRLVFSAGYLLALVLALVPATLLGGLAWLLMTSLAGASIAVALPVAALIASATLIVEMVLAIDLLGRRIDRFDVSQEMR